MLALGLTGCATHEQAGGVTGAGVGALAGHALGGDIGMLFGAVAGAAVGSEIGRQVDERDRYRAAYILERNRINQGSTWVNPETGRAYRLTPTRTWESARGPCREFRMDAQVDGQWRPVYGSACRQPDGDWQIRT